jgi:hypothetical protein
MNSNMQQYLNVLSCGCDTMKCLVCMHIKAFGDFATSPLFIKKEEPIISNHSFLCEEN